MALFSRQSYLSLLCVWTEILNLLISYGLERVPTMFIWSSSADYCLISIYKHLSRKSNNILDSTQVVLPLLS
jgi:hypothetical protein